MTKKNQLNIIGEINNQKLDENLQQKKLTDRLLYSYKKKNKEINNKHLQTLILLCKKHIFIITALPTNVDQLKKHAFSLVTKLIGSKNVPNKILIIAIKTSLYQQWN